MTALAATVAAAGNGNGDSVNLKGGKNAEPTLTDLGPEFLVLQAEGELSGLGNGDVTVAVKARANSTVTCTNPSEKNDPPGQQGKEIDVGGLVEIPEEEVKNGNTSFNVETDPPESPIPDAPDCPGGNWTETITDLAFTSATITVEQPLGTPVLEIECTIDPPSEDGTISKGDVDCTSS